MMSKAVNRHIELYRSMGFKYKVQAYMLHSFADFAQERSEEFIQTDSVLEWAASAPSVRQRHDRLLTVRRLACTLNAEDKASPGAANRRFRPRTKESSDVSHLYTGRDRSPPARRFPAHADRIDTASHVHGFAVSYRLHRPPSFRGLETRTLGPHGRRATHPCDKIPKEPPSSSSRKCTPGITAVCCCSRQGRNNYVQDLRLPARHWASVSNSERNFSASGTLSGPAGWPGARWLSSSGSETYICGPVA